MSSFYKEIPQSELDAASGHQESVKWSPHRTYSKRNLMLFVGLAWIASIVLPWSLFLYKSSDKHSSARTSPTFKFHSQDIAITMKTGASVINDRLGVHFENELANISYPYQIYSDYAQDFRGHQVIDILKNVPERVTQQNDFRPYAIQKEQLDNGVPIHELAGAWSLDKYKFIPILADSYERFPNARWYVHLEADTYMFFKNLERFLAPLNSQSQVLLGSPVKIEDAGWWFPHGGSGYVISKGLMDATFGRFPDHVKHVMDDFQNFACCGDEILARSLYSTPDVYIRSPNPISHLLFTGETPTSLWYGKQNWCLPILTMHHVRPDEIERLTQFEADMFPRLKPDDFIRQSDMFMHFIPEAWMQAYDEGLSDFEDAAWENRADDRKVDRVEGRPFDVEFCRLACAESIRCWAWQFNGDECWHSEDRLRIGGHREGFHSGWRLDRFREFRTSRHIMTDCEGRELLLDEML